MKNIKNSGYRLLSQRSSGNCPGVVEKGDEIIVIGTLLSSEEEDKMKKTTKMGVAAHERTVRIPRAVFEAAVDKLLTEKSEA